jgi:LssY-like putative type I secretion system component LssY
MRKLLPVFLLGSCVAIAQTTLPAGTELIVRLSTPVSSNASKVDQVVEALTITPVVDGSKVVLPTGVKVKGRVTEIKPAIKPDERAAVQVLFDDLGGAKTKAIVADVDNARESVDATGKIIGILASETIAARIDQGIGKVAKRSAGFAGILEAAKGAVLTAPASGEIKYEPGVELKLRLTEPLAWAQAASEPELQPIRDEADLMSVVNSQPFQTIAENPPKPSDITNLMFIGTEEQLVKAFETAGWTTAHEKNTESILETVRAIAEVRGYKEAPMSILLLDGKRSDFDFQKQNNTFAKRHHLRIWRRPATFMDKPVWVSSSTHDIGIEFSQENRTFIHAIDPQIDRERAKVVSDLLFTGKVQSLALVERAAVPKKARNATGDAIETDGRMAVVVLK